MHIGYEGSDPQDDKQDDIDRALAAAKAEALAKSITEDDVYEFACSLGLGKQSGEREKIAELMREVCYGNTPKQAIDSLFNLGAFMLNLLQENRAHRAEQKYWEEV